MIRKFFPLDKNYLLEEAQITSRQHLLVSLVEKVKSIYLQKHNPLGLQDAFTLLFATFKLKNSKPLEAFYQNLAAVYRYKHGEVQLEFVWDGRDHIEKYKVEWETAFAEWTTRFCAHELFLQAVLDLTVFLPENRHAILAENKMNHFILTHFEMRLHKSKGLVAMKVA
ncbi:MAG TPA: hypothetical protein PLM56_14815 [Cyclobacteriaceae bacterium]|nr:hypothetical protein [Cytophagales bacterium]HMR58652.1 hypothetical protein [Cyclobacteriaceae bacterium]HRE67139.1 hypothetical protein [Cyclobacteriaceae bacterium]HRF34774.1 hypothetical protein [Cyclobacteriaceae bacterium]